MWLFFRRQLLMFNFRETLQNPICRCTAGHHFSFHVSTFFNVDMYLVEQVKIEKQDGVAGRLPIFTTYLFIKKILFAANWFEES